MFKSQMNHLLFFVISVLALALGGCSEEGTPKATPTPPPKVTAQQLFSERDANATRFDDRYKGKWVHVSGVVNNIDGGTVFLKAGAIFNTVALRDLPREVQAAADKGEQFEAVCKVGNLILWTMNLEDCVAPR